MRVLVACEFSGIVRNAFATKGHDAWSCDLLPTEQLGQHYQGDVRDMLDDRWDLMIAHPPCTYLTLTGNRWFKSEYRDRFPDREERRQEAINFFMLFANAPIPKICIENPIGVISSSWRKPDQVIHPYYFGDSASKATCLWLKGLKKLYFSRDDNLFEDKTVVESDLVMTKSGKRISKWYLDTFKLPREEWSHYRSKTFQGIANAMAEQWG